MFEFDHYVPDELHELLRICDRLFLNVWQEMEKMDYLNNTFKYREDFLKELQKIGIRKCHVFDRYKKKFVLKSLNGDEDLKVLIHILKVCFPYL